MEGARTAATWRIGKDRQSCCYLSRIARPKHYLLLTPELGDAIKTLGLRRKVFPLISSGVIYTEL